jgi:methylmalonyl-CoA mutase
MIGIKETFPAVGLDEWILRLKKDLKTDDLSALNFKDEIEEITYRGFEHQESVEVASLQPGDFPYMRGANPSNTNWKNGKSILVENEKAANAKALNDLMTGIDHLEFELSDRDVHWDVLLNGIEFQYITCAFTVSNQSQLNYILDNLVATYPLQIRINLDRHKDNLYTVALDSIAERLKEKQAPILLVDGYSLQQTGANCTQELAFMAITAHSYLVDLLDRGLTVDEASACIHFRIGIGTNYFLEIAKMRALRPIWSSIVKEYQPAHACSFTCQMSAKTGLVNKSAKDPYTNLLRQTTEVMSAVLGGAQTIVVTPYDAFTQQGITELSDRMATNIALILKEESYFDAVIDPLGGSYAIEKLTDDLAEKAWSLFQSLEEKGGASSPSALEELLSKVKETGTKRILSYSDKKKTLIGVTKFPNIQMIDNSYLSNGHYLGLDLLIIERDMNYGN